MRLAFFPLFFLLTMVASRAEIITFDVLVAQDSVFVGGSVDWQVFLTVSESGADNFGIETVAIDLTDALEATLPAESARGAAFSAYVNPAGTPAPGGKLIEVSSSMFFQNTANAAAVDPANKPGSDLGPLLFASGSYQVTTLGVHELTASAGSRNAFFNSAGVITGADSELFTTAFTSDTFTVTQVPEPASLLLLSVIGGAAAIRHGRHRRSNLATHAS